MISGVEAVAVVHRRSVPCAQDDNGARSSAQIVKLTPGTSLPVEDVRKMTLA